MESPPLIAQEQNKNSFFIKNNSHNLLIDTKWMDRKEAERKSSAYDRGTLENEFYFQIEKDQQPYSL